MVLTKVPVLLNDGMGLNMSSKKRAHYVGRAVAAILLLYLSTAVIHPSAVAAGMFQKPPQGRVKKAVGGAAAKKSDETRATSAKQGKPTDAPRISLGEITGSPGASLTIPLYYTPSAAQPLRSLVVDVDFVSNHLEFQKAAPGVLPKGSEADVSATISAGNPDGNGIIRSKVQISVSLKNKNPKKGLSQGLLAFLLFQVAIDAKPFTIKLTPTVVSAEDLHTPSQKLTTISTSPGVVAVEIPDVVPKATCFFFSH